MARLYADENFDYPVVEYLRQFGHDVFRVAALGQRDTVAPVSGEHEIVRSEGRAGADRGGFLRDAQVGGAGDQAERGDTTQCGEVL